MISSFSWTLFCNSAVGNERFKFQQWQKDLLLSEFQLTPFLQQKRQNHLVVKLGVAGYQIKAWYSSRLATIQALHAKVSWQGKLFFKCFQNVLLLFCFLFLSLLLMLPFGSVPLPLFHFQSPSKCSHHASTIACSLFLAISLPYLLLTFIFDIFIREKVL